MTMEITQPGRRAAEAVSGAALARLWPSVESYLESVIPQVPERFLKEGRVQAGISRFAAPDLAVIDREAVVGFTNQAEKNRTLARLRAPLMDAVSGSGPTWWKPKPPGDECDAVAINRNGELLAIEVKPASVDVTWAPLQARHYADILQTWVDQDRHARTILTEMGEQRGQLGLLAADLPREVPKRLRVRPVVAVHTGVAEKRTVRMMQVVDRLREAGLDEPAMEFRAVHLVGRLDDWDPRAGLD